MTAWWFILASLLENKNGELLRRLKARDPQALADLYDIYGRILYLIIVRIVNDPAVAEDLVQESFFRVWNRAAALNEQYGMVGPWLLSIARNCALDYQKSPQSRMTARVHFEDVGFPPVTMDSEILTAERARILESAFQSLSANQKQVLELAYYEGLSQTAIAERLQQPLGTVKSWMRLALLKLRGQIDQSLLRSL
jgi:RNA polymerase sigma-70 factor (ECF subfamily)